MLDVWLRLGLQLTTTQMHSSMMIFIKGIFVMINLNPNVIFLNGKFYQ